MRIFFTLSNICLFQTIEYKALNILKIQASKYAFIIE